MTTEINHQVELSPGMKELEREEEMWDSMDELEYQIGFDRPVFRRGKDEGILNYWKRRIRLVARRGGG